MNLFARKNIDQLQADATAEGEHALKRELGPLNLISLGIGAIIGTGIFVLTGTAAAQHAGPAIVLAFVFAGIACVFAGLCYAEFAAMIPIAGSAYTYGYATLGELIAWIIGWDLILEYLFGAATVAAGWSGYVNSFPARPGDRASPQPHLAPGAAGAGARVGHLGAPYGGAQQVALQAGGGHQHPPQANGGFNIIAAIGIFAVTVLLVIGIKESARFNNAAVAIKLGVVGAFILAGGYYVLTHWGQAMDNWTPFIPANTGPRTFGFDGIVAAGGVIFFAYIGFDAVSTTAQEAKNPQRDMPIGILGSLLVCTVLYILVSGIMTGIVEYPRLNVGEPIAVAIEATGYTRCAADQDRRDRGLSSVMLVMLMAQPRIFYTMSRDGLLPPVFSRLHPRFRTPHISSALVGTVCALLAGCTTCRRWATWCRSARCWPSPSCAAACGTCA
jgi:APA family basic amino acid/polyamine antiporter